MTRAIVDLGALERNIDLVSRTIAPSRLMAVVKSDAYGHGAIEVSRTAVARGVTWLGVLDAATGLRLRAAGIDSETRMFAWLFSPDEPYRALIEADIDLGISHLHQLDGVVSAGASRAARLHLKIDTGLHRNGSTPDDWPALIDRAVSLDAAGVVDLQGAWTHIGEASDDDDSAAIARFGEALDVARLHGADIRVRHLAASAAGFTRSDARFDLVRVGAFMYGIAPGGGIGPRALGLEPVMTLESTVRAVEVTDGRIIVRVDAGWLDGIPAHAGGLVDLAIGGRRFRIVSVDPATCEAVAVSADVSPAAGLGPDIEPGEVATFFGPGSAGEPTLQEWADALGTIGEEIAVGVPQRVPRVYRSLPTSTG